MSNLFRLFSKKKTHPKNEHEEKIRSVLNLLELDELLQLSLDLTKKEPELGVIGYGVQQGEQFEKFEPLKKSHFEDLIVESVVNNLITYLQLQDYLIQHLLVPRDYFPERIKLDQEDIVLGFEKSIKNEALKNLYTKCARCRRFSPPFLFDHKDDNPTNNSPDNCIPLCTLCYKRKQGIPN